MIVEDQGEVLTFLASSSTHDGATVERIDTHGAVIFLAGDRAYKLKRAVRFDYMDLSTLERRQRFCEAEVRLNSRTAPDIYRGVVPVTRESNGALAIGGAGDPIDWLVEMRRFDQDQLLDRLAAAGRLDVELMVALAATIARFHAAAERSARPRGSGRHGLGRRRERGRLRGIWRRRPRPRNQRPGHEGRGAGAAATWVAARRTPPCGMGPAVPRRSASPQHRAARRAAHAVRRRRVQRRDRLHRRPGTTSRSCSWICGAPAASSRQRGLQPLRGRDRRPPGTAPAAPVPLVPCGGEGEDQRHGGSGPARPGTGAASCRRWPASTWRWPDRCFILQSAGSRCDRRLFGLGQVHGWR